MSQKTSNINWETIFRSGEVPEDLRRTIIEYQKFELLNKILPDVFHKLKNKLTPIMGYSQLLLLKMKDSDIRNKLERIEKNSDELSRLLDRLRDYFNNGKSPKARLNLNEVIRGLKPFFSEISKKHGIHVEIDLDDSIPDLDMIYGQIELLVTNVVDNAIQAIANRSQQKEPGYIQVSTRPQGEEIKLGIKDNGMGINPETLSRIWLPFYSEFPEGMGIGLLVCEKIISDHDGRFQIHSGKDAGSEFEFYFKPHK